MAGLSNAAPSRSTARSIGPIAQPSAPVKPAPAAPVAAAAAPPAPAAKPQFDLSKLLSGFGQPQPAAPMTNTSSANPTITKINESQMKDFEGDMRAGALGRASDIAIRDNAENERKAARQNAAARGVSGGGVEDIQQAAITSNTLKNQTGARVDITNDAEMRRAALGGQIAGQAALDENLQNQQRATALNQQALHAQQQQSARANELAMIKNVLDLFGEEDLFSGQAASPTASYPASGPAQMNSGRGGW